MKSIRSRKGVSDPERAALAVEKTVDVEIVTRTNQFFFTVNTEDKENKEISTMQGRDTLVPVGIVGGSAGHARPSCNDCKAPAVGNQVTVLDDTTEIHGEDDNVFVFKIPSPEETLS